MKAALIGVGGDHKIFLWGLMVCVCMADCVGEQSSSVCDADRLWELKAAFLSPSQSGKPEH